MTLTGTGRASKRSRSGATWGDWLCAATLALIAAQTAYLLVQGESYCPTTGCRVVEAQSPLSPLVMNTGGLVFFTALFVLFWALRRRGNGLAQNLLGPLLLAGIAAEGVLFIFQYQTGFFCLYCCTILAALALLNIFLGGRQTLWALCVFAAVALASLLLTAPKGISAVAQHDIDAGTLAYQEGPAGAEKRYFFFAEDCSHCKAALTALMQDRQTTLLLNPLAPPQELELAGLQRRPDFSPQANRAFLASLAIKTVPVLLVRQETGAMQVFLGAEQIMAHIRAADRSDSVGSQRRQSRQSSQETVPQTDFLIPGKDGCSMDVGCSQ